MNLNESPAPGNRPGAGRYAQPTKNQLTGERKGGISSMNMVYATMLAVAAVFVYTIWRLA